MINSFSGRYRFLSNFYPSEITIDGITYPTVEHYFQAMKTTTARLRKEIARASTPGIAKRMGRQLLLRDDWKQVKIISMMKGLLEKFTAHPELQTKLLATAPHELMEGNTWKDDYWGVCNGRGLNVLGNMLMLIRNLLAKKE